MSLSISQELRQTFHVHALRREASFLLTGHQWDAQQTLSNRCQTARDKEQRLFNERYDGRIAQEYKKLMNEGTERRKDFKPGYRLEDPFDRASLLKQADTNVRSRYEQRLARIDQFEERNLEILLQRSSRENQLTGQSKDAFACATERRSGNERRSQDQQTQQHRQVR